MADKPVLAYFRTEDDAQTALRRLRSEVRLADARVERIDRLKGELPEMPFNPIAGGFPGLGYLTLGAQPMTTGERVLAAADPSASGLAYGDETAGENVLLTAVVDDRDHDRALDVVRANGGRL
ncbi:MAG: hypothetical protein BLM47_09645 [Candidatus Reconcilbacillus cellulovorans]|uniref:Uncharacterized protein n=1 Tax=Candidatus Reconcilbacillus cellulovorans TaxID=1906605 RepID=A0A2A6DZ10_9BACL|nr:MAG: hypothetical protein BLM47_09645 [Candidatus Reconcilbacillus cellulovorans]